MKNEAVHLQDCLLSLQGQVDEIVIVDTGSTDASVAIAESAGCRVFHRAWDGDFAAPRNLGLDAAKGEWILYIDADERLVVPQNAQLRHMLPGDEAVAATLSLRPRSDMTAYSEYRLFRKHPKIRFDGVIHETHLPAIESVCREENLIVVPMHDVRLEHVGYEGDQSHKHSRNLPLLQRAIVDKPARVYLYYHLGYTLAAIGRIEEATATLVKGIAIAAGKQGIKINIEGALYCQVLAGLETEQNHPEAALAAALKGLVFFPNNLALEWAQARALVALGREDEAITILTGFLANDSDTFFDPLMAYERSLFGEDTLGLLGAAYFGLGHYDKAQHWFEKAAGVARNPLEFKAKAALAASRLGRSAFNKNA